jgi:hypothetical protein
MPPRLSRADATVIWEVHVQRQGGRFVVAAIRRRSGIGEEGSVVLGELSSPAAIRLGAGQVVLFSLVEIIWMLIASPNALRGAPKKISINRRYRIRTRE